MNSCRTVIIGLDGVPFGMIRELSESGVMPCTQQLIRDSVFRRMLSSVPEISSVAWSSMITGRNPGEHGIFGFTDLFDNSYKMRFPNFRDLKWPPFWEQWPGRSVIINVPSTYPVRKMDGVHISGFVSVDMARSVHPQWLLDKLNDMDYRLDVDSQKAHSSMELFLSDLDKTLEARIEAYRYLWDEAEWDTFMLVFTGTDRLMHFLWDAYEDERHKYHGFFMDHFRKIDEVIGRIAAGVGDDDLIIIHSDHGFERLDLDFNINHVLKENGFLVFDNDEEATLRNIDERTRAFALEPSRIYVNRNSRYPRGGVDDDAVQDVLGDIEGLFRSLELGGKKAIRETYRKEEIYSGPLTEKAPDMVLVATEGFNLRAGMKSKVLADKGIFTGKHTQESAFVIMRGTGAETIVPEVPEISDIRGLIEKANPALVRSDSCLSGSG